MKMDSKIETTRLAKNSIVLYVRMFLTMIIGLYTSRVILRELGEVDYGLYNVIGGVVTLFVFVQGSLKNASWRFITVSIGKGDLYNTQKTYSTTIYIHLLFCFILITIAETIGLWFFYNKMVIPESRQEEAFWVYQLSIITAVFSVMASPGNSLIIAREKMGVFAYVSVLESLLKLCIVFLLILFPKNKLLFYSIFLCIVQCSVSLMYLIYCSCKFDESKLIKTFDYALVKEMTIFSGFTILPGLGLAGCGQGLNILLNMFFGPTANAARGISVQVQHLVINFINSFQQASNPQITKLYASGQLEQMHSLVTKTAKFSFFLFFIPSMLLIFNIDYILRLWLDNVPKDTDVFCIFTLIISMTETLSYPFLVGAAANGNIKKYYTINGILLVSVVPISYIFLRLGYPAVYVYITHFVLSIFVMYSRIYLGSKLIKYNLDAFYKDVLFPILLTAILAISGGYFICCNVVVSNIFDYIVYLFSYGILLGMIIYMVGMNEGERIFLKNAINTLTNKYM